MHETIAHKCYKHLMSGVSYMLPFAIGGGILHALSYFLDMIMLGNSALDFGVFGTGTQVSAFNNSWRIRLSMYDTDFLRLYRHEYC